MIDDVRFLLWSVRRETSIPRPTCQGGRGAHYQGKHNSKLWPPKDDRQKIRQQTRFVQTDGVRTASMLQSDRAQRARAEEAEDRSKLAWFKQASSRGIRGFAMRAHSAPWCAMAIAIVPSILDARWPCLNVISSGASVRVMLSKAKEIMCKKDVTRKGERERGQKMDTAGTQGDSVSWRDHKFLVCCVMESGGDCRGRYQFFP